ncbi:AAA family ATPase [Haloprofundus marisrubri]|uniref:AAA family ATPase n=1 Tax=Haloprofundus marisrubri TaxID=1514971 RepID=A0A0W1R3F3_9EURY|nr:Cdc6/Cdc18 family protein [Haloprofundus marisrubri]KTG07782.1 AAA family ATPase [Haloprofundus marisrubri]
MITDARVLQAEFSPKEVEHRDQEVDVLSSALEPIVAGQPGETALIFGPSGAGKTCIAQFTVGRLQEAVGEMNQQYVNCWQDYTRFRVLYRVLEGIGRAADVHRQSTPRDELLERLRKYDGPQYVVILDEVDQLEDPRVLYDLYRMSNISMVLITNREEELFAQMDERLSSRFGSSVRIQFERYTLDELVSILSARARWGLVADAVGRQELALIGDAAAGDARVAIGILRNAAHRASREGVDEISVDVVHQSIPDGKDEVRQKTIEQFTEHQQILYNVLVDAGETQPGELYDLYCERVDDPKTRRTIRNYLSKMDHYKLVVSDGNGRNRTYRLR